MKHRIGILLSCLCMVLLCHGQESKLFTVDRELSSSMINSIYQDKDGVVWIATEDGLNRYDGAKFTAYKHIPGDDHSLMNNYTRILFEDSRGRFFVGTLNGLQQYDAATERFTYVPVVVDEFIMGINVSCMIERSNGELLVSTSGHGVFGLRYLADSLHVRRLEKEVPSFFVNKLLEDRQGNLWAATADKGLFRTSPDGTVRNYIQHLDAPEIACIYEDEYGNLYMGSLKHGLFRYDPPSDQFMPVAYPPQPHLPVKCLWQANANQLYIGTDGNGMKIYDIKQRKIVEADLPATNLNMDKAKVHAILKDRQGNTWLGCFQKGVMILPATTSNFKYVGHKSMASNIIGSCCVMSVCQSHDGTVWVGTDNDGIYAIHPDGSRRTHFAPGEGRQAVSPTIMSLCEDTDRHLWAGSYRDGLARLDPQTGQCAYIPLKDRNGVPVQSIYDIVEDRHKRLWIASMGAGLYHMDLRTGQTTLCYMPPNGNDYRLNGNMLPNAWINCLLCTTGDKLYIGTYDGLGCLDLPTMDFASTYGVNRLLEGKVVYALHEDAQGGIWIGTAQGLYHLDPPTAETTLYTTADGLPNNSISGIEGDREGNLWISTNYGIAKFNPDTRNTLCFYASNGLQGNEFTKGTSFYSPAANEMIFGGTGGITLFNPRAITGSDRKPEVRISDFYLHDTPVRKGMKSGNHDIIDTAVTRANRYRLSYKDNSFSIEFSAMEFYSPERITYSYSFNDESWISLQPGTNRVSFSDLAPGTYLFRVKAKDYNSYSEPKTITIVISPPWYATGWAWATYALVACIIITLIALQARQRYRARQRMLEHQHAEQLNEAKLQFFINISHEIRTPMSLIISPLQTLIGTDGNAERQKSYRMIYRNAQRILRLVNQLMDIRKIDKGQMHLRMRETDIVAFVQDLHNTFAYQATNKHIELTFQPDTPELKAWVDPKNFDKIVLNILSNAFKFTPENGYIRIGLHTGEDLQAPKPALRHYFELTVEDSGIGIDEKDMERIFERFYQTPGGQNHSGTGTGIGLHLTRSLVELHHGSIRVENNEDGPGCRFIIRLPLGYAHLRPEEMAEDTTPQAMPSTAAHLRPSPLPTPPTDTVDADEEKKRAKTKYQVLVVEDDEEIRRYICHELEKDFHTRECTNGKEALATVLKKAPDLIISDIMMPEMDGLTLCKKIKQNVTVNHVPIVLLTAKSREEDNLEGLSIGADAYIAKPFSIEILRQTALNLIKGREMLRNNYQGNQAQDERIQRLEVASPDERLLNRVMKVINDNMGNANLNVEMIASEVGISRVHLHRKLKELTNQSTRDLIRNVRLKQAATLLAEKRHSIAEIAAQTGFANTAYFSSAFKELYGMSPTAYMDSHGKESPAPSSQNMQDENM